MKAQKLLILTLVAGLLVLQLVPPALARTGTGTQTEETETETETETEDDDNGALSATCIISIANVIIGILNTFVPAAGLGAAACETPCGAMGTAGQCVACIFAVIPPIPLIPTTVAGCD